MAGMGILAQSPEIPKLCVWFVSGIADTSTYEALAWGERKSGATVGG